MWISQPGKKKSNSRIISVLYEQQKSRQGRRKKAELTETIKIQIQIQIQIQTQERKHRERNNKIKKTKLCTTLLPRERERQSE